MIKLRKSRFRGRVIIGPIDHAVRANRLIHIQAPSDKRRFKRFQAPKKAFVLVRGLDGKLGQIIDIGRGGLAFRYVANGKKPKKLSQLDIFLANNGFHLEKVSCEIVSDFELGKKGPSDSLTMRRCGVQFGELSQDLLSRLEYFIENYTSRTVP